MKWMNRVTHWFCDLKLGKKIFYIFIISFLIPLIVVQGVMLYVISNHMRNKVNELMLSQLAQIEERTNLTLEVYTNLVYQIYSDNEIIEDIIRYRDSEEEKEKVFREISGRIQQYGISVSGISCISIILTNGEHITYDFAQASAVDNLWMDYKDLREIEPYKRTENKNNMVISPTVRILRNNKEERVFHISKQMYDLNNVSAGTVATIVMSVDESVLHQICSVNQQTEEKNVYAVNFIADAEGNIMTYPNSFYAGITLKDTITPTEFVRRTGELKGRKTAENQYHSKKLGWTFYNVYDVDDMFREISQVQLITLLLGALIMGISLLLIRYTLRLIEQSTQAVVGGIKQVQQGNLEVQVQVYGKDELGQIAENFNEMTSKVQNLIIEVEAVTESRKEAEIRALEAQINPHFLYNTLDSINWMAIEKGEYEISTMLRYLGIILRYSISKSNKMVTVKEMSDWLDKYISLQKMRFNDAFSYAVTIDKDAEPIYVYKLLIQPFIENSIVHGFKGVKTGGMLRVDVMCSEDGEYLDIIIEDNGTGMQQEQAERFNRQEMVQDDGRSIGMQNAFARMYMYYGEKAVWNVRSMMEIGTIVTLKLPVAKEGGKNADSHC